jgi:hypothetical protein
VLRKIFASTHSREMMRNWSSWVEFSSFGIHTPSATLQKTCRIFHRRSRSLGQFLYTLYEVPLGPGAELALALRTTSLTSFSCSSDMSNCTSGSGGSMRMLHSPSSCSLAGSLYVCFRCWSMSSCEEASLPLRFYPNKSMVNLKGLEIKAAR